MGWAAELSETGEERERGVGTVELARTRCAGRAGGPVRVVAKKYFPISNSKIEKRMEKIYLESQINSKWAKISHVAILTYFSKFH